MEVAEHDFHRIITDVKAAWEFASTFSHEEIHSLITNNESRESDVIVKWPLAVSIALGEEFVPRGKLLAELRGKFGETKGKTVFETFPGGDECALELLWGELVGEVRRGGECGPVGVALREALGRMEGLNVARLLSHLEGKVKRRTLRGACRRQEEESGVVEGGACDQVGGVMDWVTRDLQWKRSFIPSAFDDSFFSFLPVPFLIRYCDNVDSSHLAPLLLRKFQFSPEVLKAFLQSLVIVSSPRPPGDDPSVFSVLSAFLRQNLDEIPPSWLPVVEVLLGATREQIAEAAAPPSLVGGVSVGGVFLRLIQQQPILPKDTWAIIVGDVIDQTPCCDLPAVLEGFRLQMSPQGEGLLPGEELLLREVLTSYEVMWAFHEKFSRTHGDPSDTCGVRNFLAFYFSVYGLNCEWMREGEGGVGAEGYFPVEIANALSGEWPQLLPPFGEVLREHLRKEEVVRVEQVAEWFSYETQGECETLFTLIDVEALLPADPSDDICIPSAVAAPFVRALIRLYGVEWTKKRLTREFWEQTGVTEAWEFGSVGAVGSLLHSAIQLGELEAVEQRAWPGLVRWRNGEGKTALEVAREELEEPHPIRTHLEKLQLSLPTSS